MQPILKLNLTTGETTEYPIPPAWERDYLGGASLAARILYPSLTQQLDPFSPEVSAAVPQRPADWLGWSHHRAVFGLRQIPGDRPVG